MGNATQAEWIRTHSAAPDTVEILKNYVRVNGRQLNKLESGTYRYAIMGISVVVDSQHEAGTCSRNAKSSFTSKRSFIMTDGMKKGV